MKKASHNLILEIKKLMDFLSPNLKAHKLATEISNNKKSPYDGPVS
jgi:hypothetical protein